MEILSHPLMYVMAAIVGFFLKDLFTRIQRTSDLKSEIDRLKDRVISLEVSHKELNEMSKNITRLEEQVKRLIEDIKFLIMRANDGKTDHS